MPDWSGLHPSAQEGRPVGGCSFASRAGTIDDTVELNRAPVRPLLIDTDVMAEIDTTPFVLPTGTFTFLLTDVEGSTIAWQRNPISCLP